MSTRPRAASQPDGSLVPPRSMPQRPRSSSSRPWSCLEEELTCPVCCEIFHDPVVLKCSHSFCRSCLQRLWARSNGTRECPVCRQRAPAADPPISLTLKNVAETFMQQGHVQCAQTQPQELCMSHGEVLKLFCQEDQAALCCVCHTSRWHRQHHVCPLEEAAPELKTGVRNDLDKLKRNLRQLYEAKQECDDTAVHVKDQLERTEKQMRDEFEEMHQFLRREESERTAALRQEHDRKKQMIKAKADELTREILSLSQAVISVDNEVAASDARFLQNYRSTKARSQSTVPEPERIPGALMEVAHHLGSLKYKVWEKMMAIIQYTPVTLDPNTAYAWLSLSPDLTAVTNTGRMQNAPNNPERFDHLVFVLGSEGFASGLHAWEVEVGKKEDWVLGVVKESINRKGKISGRPEDGFWTIAHSQGEFTAMTTPRTLLNVPGLLERVRVQLDYSAGQVSFVNPVTMATIYTFKDRFTEKMLPFFCPGANVNGNNSDPLKICPARIAVWNSATW